MGSICDQCYSVITRQLTSGLLLILHLKITRACNVQNLGVARQWDDGGGRADLLYYQTQEKKGKNPSLEIGEGRCELYG